jgi:hypothetical protein
MARSSYKYKIKDRNFISDEIERIMLTPESDDLSDDSLERNEMAQAQSSQCYSDQQHIISRVSALYTLTNGHMNPTTCHLPHLRPLWSLHHLRLDLVEVEEARPRQQDPRHRIASTSPRDPHPGH